MFPRQETSSSEETLIVPAAPSETFLDCMKSPVLRMRLLLALLGWYVSSRPAQCGADGKAATGRAHVVGAVSVRALCCWLSKDCLCDVSVIVTKSTKHLFSVVVERSYCLYSYLLILVDSSY